MSTTAVTSSAATSPEHDGGKTVELNPLAILKNGDVFKTVRFDYHDGLRYPHLERIEGTPDRLGDILSPRRR